MIPFAAATGVQAAAALAAAAAAACVLALPDARHRRMAMPVALVLAALTIAAAAEDQVREQLSGRLALAAVAAVVGLAGLVALGLAFRRWPAAFVVAAVVAVPARIPIGIGGETVNLLLPLYLVIAGAVVAALLGAPRAQEPPAQRTVTIQRALALVVVLYAVQALYSTDVEAAVKDIAFFYVPFAVLLRLLVDAPWDGRLLRIVLGTVVGLAVLFALVGLYQYATRSLLLDNEKVLLANELKPYFRVNSLFFDPNIYGRFLALTMLLLAAVLLWSPTRERISLCAVGLAVLWAGLVPSLSESSFASLALGLGVLAGLRWSWRPVIAAAAGLAVVGVVLILAAPDVVGISAKSFERLDRSTSGRAELVRGGIEMAADRPIAGFGSGSFAERYRAREELLSERSPAESHTIPITVAAEQGVIGLVGYVVLIATAVSLVLGGVDRRAARAAVAAAFLALVLHTLVYAAFLEDPITWVLLAAALVLRRAPFADDVRDRRATRAARAAATA
jgi:O-antigen ligase